MTPLYIFSTKPFPLLYAPKLFFTCVWFQAFNSSDDEWSVHKKLIDLTTKRPLSSAVPKHWEYLAAEWGSGTEGDSAVIGAAHAVENESKIKPDFCLDVVAGMLDVVRHLFLFNISSIYHRFDTTISSIVLLC